MHWFVGTVKRPAVQLGVRRQHCSEVPSGWNDVAALRQSEVRDDVVACDKKQLEGGAAHLLLGKWRLS